MRMHVNQMECTLHMYTMMGEHVQRLPYTACNWQESLKQPGSMDCTVILDDDTWYGWFWTRLRPWKCILALQQGDQVKHAGPLTDLKWDATSRTLNLTCGGGLTLLTKRLVLRHELKDHWRDGRIRVDEKHPATNMQLEYRRTWWFAICARLIMETKQWGDLPIDLPDLEEPGDKQRTYYSWDLATVADRICDIMGLEGGNEIRFDPYIDEETGNLRFQMVAGKPYYSWDLATVADRICDIMGLEGGNEIRFDPYIDEETGNLRFQMVAGKPYLVSHEHQWSAVAPDSRVDLVSITASGANLTTQVWATAGKDNDETLMCRRTATPQDGYMLMQSSNTSHTTVSRLNTLQQHATAQLAGGYWPSESFELAVGEEYDIAVGDHADVRVSDDYLLNTLQQHATAQLAGGYWPSESFELAVGEEYDIAVGDHADVRVSDDYLGDQLLRLKITDIRGDVSKDMLTVTAVERST